MEDIIPTIDGGVAAPIAAGHFYQGQSFREQLQRVDMQLQQLEQTDTQLQNHDMGLLDRCESQTRMEIQEQGSLLSQPIPTDIFDDFCPSLINFPSPIESWEQLEKADTQAVDDNFLVELAAISDGAEMTNDVMMSMGRMPQHSFGDSRRTNEATPNMLVRPQHLSSRPIGLLYQTPLQLFHSANGTSQLPFQGSCLQGGTSQLALQGSCLQGESVLPSTDNPLRRIQNQTFNIMHLALPFHLPAPPEADPQVMLAKRPRNGRFLESVILASLEWLDYVKTIKSNFL